MSPERIARQSLAIILAGGHGRRLGALTRRRCKPALPFGGRYRSIDFTLSNCVNSGMTRIGVATQYQSQPLIQHLQQGWQFLCRERGECIELWAADQGDEGNWYAGTADAVYQNLGSINRHEPRYVVVLAADHIYRMDYSALLTAHHDSRADVTVACVPVPAAQANQFGIMSVNGNDIVDFQEKPALDNSGEDVLASMGVYVFTTDFLRNLLVVDALDRESSHDFGRDLIPACVRQPAIRAVAHRYCDPVTGNAGYWRDIGTVDGYFTANMELLAGATGFDLYDPEWPILGGPDRLAPTRVGEAADGTPTRISGSIVAGGCRLDGASVHGSIVSSGVFVGSGSVVIDSILLPGARIGANCRLERAIVDERMVLPNDTCVGDHARHAAHGEVSPGGVTVLSSRPDTRVAEAWRDGLRKVSALKKPERAEHHPQPHREPQPSHQRIVQ